MSLFEHAKKEIYFQKMYIKDYVNSNCTQQWVNNIVINDAEMERTLRQRGLGSEHRYALLKSKTSWLKEERKYLNDCMKSNDYFTADGEKLSAIKAELSRRRRERI